MLTHPVLEDDPMSPDPLSAGIVSHHQPLQPQPRAAPPQPIVDRNGTVTAHRSTTTTTNITEWGAGSKERDLDEHSVSSRSWDVARQIMDSDVLSLSFGRRSQHHDSVGNNNNNDDDDDENDDILSVHSSRQHHHHHSLPSSAIRVTEYESNQTLNLYDFNYNDRHHANGMYQNTYQSHHHQPRHGGGILLRCFTCWTDTVRLSRRTYWICLGVLLLVLIIVIPVGVTIHNSNNNAVPSEEAAAVTMTYRPTLPPHTFQTHDQSFTHGLVSSLLMHFGILNIHTFENVNSPQRRAVEYLVGSILSKTKLTSDGFHQDWKSVQELRNLVDMYVLAVLFYDTSGFQWTIQTKWLDPKLENPCSWYGITCDHEVVATSTNTTARAGGSSSVNKTVLTIVRINLQDNSLMGTIPTELQFLNSLQQFNVTKNELQGPIPLESFPTSLQTLSLAKNRLTNPDTTTTSIWQPKLRNLQVLDLHENDLHGPFLSSTTNMLALRILNLQHNFLTGTVPIFPQLEHLRLDMNRFSGSLPWNLPTSLKELTVRQNRLHGSFPDNIIALSTLESLDVGKNAMTGTLDVCAKLVFLRQLIVDQNSFTGTLPSLATPLLTHYIASTNQLYGTIPVSVGVLWNLQVLALDHNTALNGTLVPSQPPQLEQLTNLKVLNLVDTNLVGTISQTLANQLDELHLSSQLIIGGS